ncbi:hypothetical protein BD310DRAFT_1034097 [Dichomitus squalens]|uniref:Chromo domain-containing protein n=1 Tax=Dichomitus squalens TaxID=114155 RepID=A0A4Q9QDG8_9APHY|nr:hypothetical protein BD310DRAFT_1034097 [Dichomitus squalens]
MSESESEYEVESILRAKVEGGKRGRKAWSYLVKWKNYGHEDNTWEPTTSFGDGSEHFIDEFWSRIDVQGRDITNLRDFSVGEEFFPSGPPRKKKVKRARTPEESPEPPIQLSDPEQEDGPVTHEVEESAASPLPTRSKRPRPSVDEEKPAASKRKRGPPGIPARELAQSAHSKRKRSPVGSSVHEDEEISVPTTRKRGPPGIPARELHEPTPPPKRKRGPPGIPAAIVELQTLRPLKAEPLRAFSQGVEEEIAQLELEPVIADEPAPSPTKRRRGRPPGIRPAQLEAEEKAAVEAAAVAAAKAASPRKALNGRRVVPDSRAERVVPDSRAGRVVPDSQAESSRGRKAVATEPASSSPRRLSLPRRRGRHPKTAPPTKKSPSADELLIVSDSDEGKGKARGKAHAPRGNANGTSAQEPMDVGALPDPPSIFGVPSLLSPDPSSVPEALPESQTTPPSPPPAHRLRAANPRVKIADDPHLTEVNGPEAIAVKARFMKRAANGRDKSSDNNHSAFVSGSKAGPGRSSSGLFPENSRLTVQKGVLTSVKPKKTRKAIAEEVPAVEQNGSPAFDSAEATEMPGLGQLDVQPEPESTPTGQELLEAAGMNDKAVEDLPDFEDAGGDGEPPSAPEAQNEVIEVESPRAFESPSAAQAGETAALQAKPLTFTSRVSMWGQSTIFGPLTLGFTGRAQSETGAADPSAEAKRYNFYLNLDPAVSVPITLKDVQASQTFLDGLDSTARNPTGKFYKDSHAIALVGTLKAKRSYARVVPGDASTDEQKKHFERFITRLRAGELFIQMNRAETLVMCASENAILGQRLGIPAQLLGLGDTAIVAHVDVENYSQYAEAAVHADTARW